MSGENILTNMFPTLVTVFVFAGATLGQPVDLCSSLQDVGWYRPQNSPTQNCGCDQQRCARKCCRPGFLYKNKTCVNRFRDDLSVPVYVGRKFVASLDRVENYTIGLMGCEKTFRFNLSTHGDDIYLQENGMLLLYIRYTEIMTDNERYCLNGDGSVTVCSPTDSTAKQSLLINGYGMIISMPFLLITFIVYLILPDKNLHRKALMFYVVSLLLGYIFLVTNQLTDYSFEDVPCHIFGYAIIFFFLVSFFWMNVMCIDMWLTFSGVRGFGWKRSSEKKRFTFYCLYALGVPVVHVFVVFLLNKYGDKKAIYHPLIGENKCFLEDGFPILFYFYLPMSVLIGINIVLFILTTIKIQRVKKETSMLKQHDSQRHAYENDRQRFNLYLKLLFAMGINWTMELISWAVLWKMQQRAPWIWYLTDLTNALYGVFIFAMFVFKKKIWQSLKKRYYVFRGKPHLAQTIITSSQMTRTSHMSASEGEYRMSDMRNGRGEERALRS